MTMSMSFFIRGLLRGVTRELYCPTPPGIGVTRVLTQRAEVNGRLVGPLVFKTSGTGDPRPVGSIPATSAVFLGGSRRLPPGPVTALWRPYADTTRSGRP